jgi:hypothetical protein
VAVAAGAIGVALVVAAVAPDRAAVRWALAVVFGTLLVWLCLRSFDTGVLVTLAWLLTVALSRRLVTEIQADPAREPLLLVGPAAAAVLCATSVLRSSRRMGVLAWSVLAFSAVVVLEVVNLRATGILGSFAGLLVWIVPMLWFWIGRSASDDLTRRVLAVFAIGAGAAALYGLGQSLVGFPPWDERWIEHRGYAALFIGPTTVRPFGSFASGAEFAIVCAIGSVLTFVAWSVPRLLAPAVTSSDERRRRRLVVAAGGCGFLLFVAALALSAVRTTMLLLAIALLLTYFVAKRWRSLLVIVPVALLTVAALAALSTVDPDSLDREGAEAALRRVVVAVRDPFVANRENTDNTLQLHWDNFRAGIDTAFDRPLGSGTGATGPVAAQFGDSGTTTDTDVSDAGVAFGVVGVALTAWIVIITLGAAVSRAWRRPTYESVVLVGILVVSLRSWWAGGHYAAAPLLWFLVGRLSVTMTAARRA